MTARGIRNNNPLNIEKGADWQGLNPDQSSDDRFAVFMAPKYGFRAAAIILLGYQKKHGLNSIAAIIGRWAPPVENDTGAYAAAVSREVGVQPGDAVKLTEAAILLPLLRAMCRHENGSCPYDDQTIEAGMKLAGVERPETPADFSNVESGVTSTAPEVKS